MSGLGAAARTAPLSEGRGSREERESWCWEVFFLLHPVRFTEVKTQERGSALVQKNPRIPLLDSTGSPGNVLLPGPHLGGTHHNIWEAAGTALGGQKLVGLFFFFFGHFFKCQNHISGNFR